MDTSEKRFERDIESFLISKEGGYVQFNGQDKEGNWIHNKSHDLGKCIYMDVLVEFIEKTQPKEWTKYKKYYGDQACDKLYARLETTISNQGLLWVLRNGIEDMGCKLKICYFKPASNLNVLDAEHYAANILGCTRQFRYSPKLGNTIDMVLSVNGIPVVALELKNQLKGQDYTCGIRQFKEDRNSKEFCFRRDHRFLVYFAVDLYEAWMTTELADNSTHFLPFNQGSNGPGVEGGKGNPHNPEGYATDYLWKRVLQRDSLLDLIHRFISHKVEIKNGKKKETMLFPRFHQYDVVHKLMDDVRSNGAGKNYLIQHSAGSGKSNSIAWTAYRLASIHDANDNGLFRSVIVVTNRVVLDGQLQDTINSFECRVGLVEAIDEKKNSKSLAEAINDGKRIIICTIQKFLFAQKDIENFKGYKFAVIVDEAHQGQNGESAKKLRRSLIDMGIAVKEYAEEEGIEESEVNLTDAYINALIAQGKHQNQSFFAFTATPKRETIEIFGKSNSDGTRSAFHVYSMRQAIDEGYIHDVLANYTTIKEAFKLIKVSEDNPELIQGEASKALVKYYRQNEFTIAKKVEMIMTNFLDNCRYQINHQGKAMVVTDSRASAVRYYLEIKRYIANHKELCAGTDAMVAFSGEVKLDENPTMTYTEAVMNKDEKGKYITSDKKFREVFHSSLYNILVVADKYQTGFDEALLHTMYVDKKLEDITAVQTLSRLNRTTAGKNGTFVLDFVNTNEDIKNAFADYFWTTTLEGETDVNKVYDLRAKIRDYLLYNFEDIVIFRDFMAKQKGKNQTDAALGALASMFAPVIERFSELDEDSRNLARDYIRKFKNAYAYVTQLVRINDRDLFDEYQYIKYLIKLLPREKTEHVDIDDKIKLEYVSLKESFNGEICLFEKPKNLYVVDDVPPKKLEKKKDTLQSIIEHVNERFVGEFSEGDRVVVEGIYKQFMQDVELSKYKQFAKTNSAEMFEKSIFPEKFKDLVTQCFLNNSEAFDKLFSDTEFYAQVQAAMAKELFKALRM